MGVLMIYPSRTHTHIACFDLLHCAGEDLEMKYFLRVTSPDVKDGENHSIAQRGPVIGTRDAGYCIHHDRHEF